MLLCVCVVFPFVVLKILVIYLLTREKKIHSILNAPRFSFLSSLTFTWPHCLLSQHIVKVFRQNHVQREFITL